MNYEQKLEQCRREIRLALISKYYRQLDRYAVYSHLRKGHSLGDIQTFKETFKFELNTVDSALKNLKILRA